MAKKIGTLIKEARTQAGLTQEELAKKVKGVTAADIGKAERGEKELTQEQLKAVAKATGVTQKSLLDAAKESGKKESSAAKTASSKKTAGAKTASSAKKTSSAKTSSSSGTTMKVTAAEKKLLELYRAADSDTKKAVSSLLKGEDQAGSLISNLFGNKKDAEKIIGNLVGGAMNILGGKK